MFTAIIKLSKLKRLINHWLTLDYLCVRFLWKICGHIVRTMKLQPIYNLGSAWVIWYGETTASLLLCNGGWKPRPYEIVLHWPGNLLNCKYGRIFVSGVCIIICFMAKSADCIYRIWKNYSFVSVNIPWMINKFNPNAYKCVGMYNNIRISLHGLPIVNAIYIYMFMYILLQISYLMNKCNLPAWMFSCFPRGLKNKRTHTILKKLCVWIRGIFVTS